MNITLNGSIFIDSKEVYFEDFDVEINEDLDLPFDFLTDDEEDYCVGDCEDCEFCENEDEDKIEFDLDDDERFDSYSQDYKYFLSEHVRKIYDTDFCPHCIAEILDVFYEEVAKDLGCL